jgi:hypothetical protein
MSLLPETLGETIAMIKKEIESVVCTDSVDVEERDASKRLLEWLEDLHNLRSDDKAAINNAVDALRRIADGIEMNPLVTTGDKHYVNRLNKLINNLEEVIELEGKKHEAERISNADKGGRGQKPKSSRSRGRSRQ